MVVSALSPLLSASSPGTLVAALHVPLRCTMTNACERLVESLYCPAPAQLPAEAQESELIWPNPPIPLRLATPGAGMALFHRPFFWVTTKGQMWPGPSVYDPAALQLPAEAHDTDVMKASWPALSVPVPGTCSAVRQVPFR